MPSLDPDAALALVVPARVGRLGTIGAGGRPHLVPCCFAIVGRSVVSVVDGKPKSTGQLRRLDNIRARPAASLLVDHYDDDWSTLWWVRVDGGARVVEPGSERADQRDEYTTAVDALVDKYPQYADRRPDGALVVIDVERLTGWSFSEPPPDPEVRQYRG